MFFIGGHVLLEDNENYYGLKLMVIIRKKELLISQSKEFPKDDKDIALKLQFEDIAKVKKLLTIH